MSDSLTIRPFEPADEEAVIRLWHECGLVVPWNDPAKDLSRKLDDSPELLLVAIASNQLVGVVMAGYDGHRGAINYLAVAPGQQGAGIGKALMERAEQMLTDLGCPKINLFVRATNLKVIDFYERLGYSQETGKTVALGKRLIVD